MDSDVLPQRERKPRPKAGPEKRTDPTDGQEYTREEFVACYGGTGEWEAAAALQRVSGPNELRLDPRDGQVYTRDEFIAEYGGLEEWDAAGRVHQYVDVREEEKEEEEAEAAAEAAYPAAAAAVGQWGDPERLDDGEYLDVAARSGSWLTSVLRPRRDDQTVLELRLGEYCLGDSGAAEALQRLPDAVAQLIEPETSALCVSLQGNSLGERAVQELCAALACVRNNHGLVVDRMQLHRNDLTDTAAVVLANQWLHPQAQWCAAHSIPVLPTEVHLSHNRIGRRGAASLIRAALAHWPAKRGSGDVRAPLWMRLEYNVVEKPAEVIREFGDAVYTRPPDKAGDAHPALQCSRWAPDASVYLPYFDHQRDFAEAEGARKVRVKSTQCDGRPAGPRVAVSALLSAPTVRAVLGRCTDLQRMCGPLVPLHTPQGLAPERGARGRARFTSLLVSRSAAVARGVLSATGDSGAVATCACHAVVAAAPQDRVSDELVAAFRKWAGGDVPGAPPAAAFELWGVDVDVHC